jgi:hypothetical protein
MKIILSVPADEIQQGDLIVCVAANGIVTQEVTATFNTGHARIQLRVSDALSSNSIWFDDKQLISIMRDIP